MTIDTSRYATTPIAQLYSMRNAELNKLSSSDLYGYEHFRQRHSQLGTERRDTATGAIIAKPSVPVTVASMFLGGIIGAAPLVTYFERRGLSTGALATATILAGMGVGAALGGFAGAAISKRIDRSNIEHFTGASAPTRTLADIDASIYQRKYAAFSPAFVDAAVSSAQLRTDKLLVSLDRNHDGIVSIPDVHNADDLVRNEGIFRWSMSHDRDTEPFSSGNAHKPVTHGFDDNADLTPVLRKYDANHDSQLDNTELLSLVEHEPHIRANMYKNETSLLSGYVNG